MPGLLAHPEFTFHLKQASKHDEGWNPLDFHPSHRLALTSLAGIVRQAIRLV
jgi:hypothetical protein